MRGRKKLTGKWAWSSPRTNARIIFTTTPTEAIIDISFPSTWNSSPPTYRIIHTRCVASTANTMDKMTRHTIEKRAARLSVRFSPYVCDADAGRLAMWKPIMATRKADRSAARCAASDNTAREPAKSPPITSTKKNVKQRRDAVWSFFSTTLRRSLSSAASWWGWCSSECSCCDGDWTVRLGLRVDRRILIVPHKNTHCMTMAMGMINTHFRVSILVWWG